MAAAHVVTDAVAAVMVMMMMMMAMMMVMLMCSPMCPMTTQSMQISSQERTHDK